MTFKQGYCLNLLMAIVGLVILFYLQYVENIRPCLLCLIERFFLYLLVIVYLAAVCIPLRGKVFKNIIHGFTFLFSLLGLLTALRQLWLQNVLPNGPVQCLPDAVQMLHFLPWQNVIAVAYTNSSYCMTVTTFWGVSTAIWAILGFCAFLAVTAYTFKKSSG